MSEVEKLLGLLRAGNFDAREALLHEMGKEVREQRIHQWFYDMGHSARHADVAVLRAVLNTAREPAVVRRVLTSLAYSLSLDAALAILDHQLQSDAEEDDGYALQLAKIVVKLEGIDEYSFREQDGGSPVGC